MMTPSTTRLAPSIGQLLNFAAEYQPPAVLPAGDEAATKVVYDLTKVWALQLATGAITLDDAYMLAKAAAQNLEVHTQGRRRWKAIKPFLEWLVETTAERMAAHFAVADDAALRALKRTALAALARGAGEIQLREAIATAASTMDPAPPVDVLHQAYHDAVREARSNTRWMTQRAAQA